MAINYNSRVVCCTTSELSSVLFMEAIIFAAISEWFKHSKKLLLYLIGYEEAKYLSSCSPSRPHGQWEDKESI